MSQTDSVNSALELGRNSCLQRTWVALRKEKQVKRQYHQSTSNITITLLSRVSYQWEGKKGRNTTHIFSGGNVREQLKSYYQNPKRVSREGKCWKIRIAAFFRIVTPLRSSSGIFRSANQATWLWNNNNMCNPRWVWKEEIQEFSIMNSEKESTYSTVLKKIGQSIIIDRKKLSQCSVDRERRESRGIRKKKSLQEIKPAES